MSAAVDLQAAGRAVAIAALNDLFRKSLGAAEVFRSCPGILNLTPEVSDLTNHDRRKLLEEVIAFDQFKEGNDPYGEHDFGALGEYFWKIDYYNATLDGHADDPANVNTCRRVLTIMHRSEY